MVSKAPPPLNYKSRGVAAVVPRTAPRKPNWKQKWSKMISAPLWQAVALSLNYEPDDICAPSSGTNYGLALKFKPPDYADRLDVAVNHLESGKFLSTQWADNPPYREVELRPFGSWAISQGLWIPDEFPRDLEPSPTPRVRGPGRPSGEGPYEANDALLVQEMHAIRFADPDKTVPISAALGAVSARAEGSRHKDSIERRLRKKYNDKYPPEY